MTKSENLESIPGIGPKLAKMLSAVGIKKVRELKDKDPEKLFRRLEKVKGQSIDRCVLYAFRCAVYYASNTHHAPLKLKWWNWKDK